MMVWVTSTCILLSKWAVPGSLIHGILPHACDSDPSSNICRSTNLYSIALSPDSNYVATGSNDGIIILRNISDIIPSSLRVDQMICRSGAQMQTEARDTSIIPGVFDLRSGAFPYNPICIH